MISSHLARWLNWLERCIGLAEVRIRIPTSLNSFTRSYRNYKSCVFICDDLCIQYLRQSVNSVVSLLCLVPEDMSKTVHELNIGGRTNKHVSGDINSTIALVFQADFLQQNRQRARFTCATVLRWRLCSF